MTRNFIKPQNSKGSNQEKAVEKAGSSKNAFEGNLSFGINRRAFLQISSAAAVSAAVPACSSPEYSEADNTKTDTTKPENIKVAPTKSLFDPEQKKIIQSVQQHLLPDDGDGPDAKAINAYGYLEFALTDKKNIADGDPEYIAKGIGWLEELSKQSQGDSFLKLTQDKQSQLLERIATSSAGENWLSLLIYYLTEALLLDPIYGGNTEQKGWQWLEHQAGFPRPIKSKTYRDFE